MMDNWEGDRRRGASLSATQLAAAEVKFRQNIALLNLSSQYWLIIRQANTALHSPTALSWTPRRGETRMWRLWVWRLKYCDGHGLGLASCQRRRGREENVKLIYCHGLESCKFSVPVCNVSVMETNVCSSQPSSGYSGSWSLNVLSMVISIWRNPGSWVELFLSYSSFVMWQARS